MHKNVKVNQYKLLNLLKKERKHSRDHGDWVYSNRKVTHFPRDNLLGYTVLYEAITLYNPSHQGKSYHIYILTRDETK